MYFECLNGIEVKKVKDPQSANQVVVHTSFYIEGSYIDNLINSCLFPSSSFHCISGSSLLGFVTFLHRHGVLLQHTYHVVQIFSNLMFRSNRNMKAVNKMSTLDLLGFSLYGEEKFCFLRPQCIHVQAKNMYEFRLNPSYQ